MLFRSHLCLALPDAYEEHAWVGTRWRVRNQTFVHVLGIDDPLEGAHVVMTFRASSEEFAALQHAGPPFYVLGWGRDAMGLKLGATTDWDEVAELVVESYCVLAPKKLVALVDRPSTKAPE